MLARVPARERACAGRDRSGGAVMTQTRGTRRWQTACAHVVMHACACTCAHARRRRKRRRNTRNTRSIARASVPCFCACTCARECAPHTTPAPRATQHHMQPINKMSLFFYIVLFCEKRSVGRRSRRSQTKRSDPTTTTTTTITTMTMTRCSRTCIHVRRHAQARMPHDPR